MDPVQNLSIKTKEYPWTWSMTGGPWNRSKVGVQGLLVHVLSFGSKAITRLSFQIKAFPSLICLLAGWFVRIRRKFLWRIRHRAGSWMAAAENFPPIHTSGMSLSSQANHSSHRLYKVYKRHGGVLLRFWPCICLSFNIKFDHDPFDVFICCSTVILKNALMLKVALKIVTLIFWDCFHLDFKDHVSRRKYYAARNLSCDRCVI